MATRPYFFDVPKVSTQTIANADTTGLKTVVTGAANGTIVSVYGDAVSLAGQNQVVVIDKGMAGVSFGANERKLGWHSSDTHPLAFDDCRVPGACLLGGKLSREL